MVRSVECFHAKNLHGLLVEHVPGLGNELLALTTSVEVQPGREAHERHVLSHFDQCLQHTGTRVE